MPEMCALHGRSPAALRMALEEALNDVLERMFFVGSGEAAPEAENSRPGIQASLEYKGDVAGWLRLGTTEAAARGLSADFLGCAEEDLAESAIREVICELANMICGAVLSRMAPSAAIRLGSPRITGCEASPGANLTSCSVRTGRGIVTVTLSMEEPACLPDEKRGS